MRKACTILLYLFTFFQTHSSAQTYTISGYITDGKSGETLIGASVFEILSKKGVVSNLYGFYSLTLPKGDVQLQYSYVGYTPQTNHFDLVKDTVINIRMTENNVLQEVTIIGTRQVSGVHSSQMGAIDIPVAQVKTIPSLFGETDLIKALQLLPGVQAGAEGFTGFYVRGGGPDENLFLLDGVPIYNINHMGGFFSVFNTDAIKNVTLYKGGFPARFGSRLSSVLDIRMNDGNNKKLHGNVSIGLITSKINLEGPLFSEKTTFNVSARRTYMDVMAKPIISMAASESDVEKLSAGYYFYDLNAKISHKFSDKDRLYLSFYMGDDVIYANMEDKYDSYDYGENGSTVKGSITDKVKMNWNWGNMLSVIRWNRIINNKLFMNTTFNYTRYRFDVGIGSSEKFSQPDPENFEANLTYKSGIEDFSGKIDFDYSPAPNHDIKFGVNYIKHTFRPSVMVAKIRERDEAPLDTVIGDNNISTQETALYLEDNFSIGHFVKMNAGLHYSTFYVQDKFYHSLQPRLNMRFLLNDDFSMKAGYTYMSQYIHLLSNNSISLPTDLWVPVTKRIEPMQSHQVSLGAFYKLHDWVDFSLEGYYKSMNNMIEYKDGATFLGSTTGWEDKVSVGKGWAYGVEFLAQKTVGKTTGWLGYTWSKTERLFDRPGDELNFGKVFPAKYDRRHDLNLVVTHKFSTKIDASATWVYSTGNCGTLGLQDYYNSPVPQSGASFSSWYGNHLTHIDRKNNFRYPDYQRLDLGVNFHKQRKHGISTWSISVYNVYNRLNPFFVYPDTEYEMNIVQTPQGPSYEYKERKTLKQISIFPIIPSVSYSYMF
jgi:outer membrane receptor for ferrienterochelin and colicin